ncbi:MAG TPA: hypothetical protein VK539_03095 [Myxococcaceae bacterium]|nr:hypothetical protein [Myxococcaceae bacterium]
MEKSPENMTLNTQPPAAELQPSEVDPKFINKLAHLVLEELERHPHTIAAKGLRKGKSSFQKLKSWLGW